MCLGMCADVLDLSSTCGTSQPSLCTERSHHLLLAVITSITPIRLIKIIIIIMIKISLGRRFISSFFANTHMFSLIILNIVEMQKTGKIEAIVSNVSNNPISSRQM